jgi:hypothetical protein
MKAHEAGKGPAWHSCDFWRRLRISGYTPVGDSRFSTDFGLLCSSDARVFHAGFIASIGPGLAARQLQTPDLGILGNLGLKSRAEPNTW